MTLSNALFFTKKRKIKLRLIQIMRNKLTALHTGYIYICLVSIWLLSSAALIEIESEDGISTIISSLHLVGATEHHSFNQRGPLFVLFLYPAAWLSNALDLHALDLRLYHYSFAFLHILYLVLVWQKINRIFLKRHPPLDRLCKLHHNFHLL